MANDTPEAPGMAARAAVDDPDPISVPSERQHDQLVKGSTRAVRYPWIRALDAWLRVRWPRLWALQLPYFVLAVLGGPLASHAMDHARAGPTAWSTLTPDGPVGAALAISTILVAVWIFMTMRARHSLPRSHHLGWALGPVCTMAMISVALLATAFSAASSVDAANRAVRSRDELIADADLLGALVTSGDDEVRIRVSFDLRNMKSTAARICQLLLFTGQIFEDTALRYAAPRARHTLHERIANERKACQFRGHGGYSEVMLFGLSEVWRPVAQLAAAHGIDTGEYSRRATRMSAFVVLALDLAIFGTAVMSILTWMAWRDLRSILLAMTVLYFVCDTAAPSHGNLRASIFSTVIYWSVLTTITGIIALTVALAAHVLRWRSPLTDRAFGALLILPAFGAAMASNCSIPSIIENQRGWEAHDVFGCELWIPNDPDLARGFIIVVVFAALTPLLHLLIERYRRLRWSA